MPNFQEKRSIIFVRACFSAYFQESAFLVVDLPCAEGPLDRSRIEDFRPFFLSFFEEHNLHYTFIYSQNFLALCLLFRCSRKEMAREGADGCLTNGEPPTSCPGTPEASKQTTLCARHAQSASSPKVQGMRDDPFAGLRGRSSMESLILCSKTTPLPSQTLGNVTARGWRVHKTAIYQVFRYITLILRTRMKISQKISHMKLIFDELRRIEAPKKDFESKFESKFDFDSILDFEIEASIRCQPW